MAGWFMCSVRYSYTARVPHCDTTHQFHLYNNVSTMPLLFLIGLYSVWWQSVWGSCTEDLQGKKKTEILKCVHVCAYLYVYVKKALTTGSFCFILDLSNTRLNAQHLNLLRPGYGPGHDSRSSSHRIERLWWSSDPGRSRVFGWLCGYIPGMFIL